MTDTAHSFPFKGRTYTLDPAKLGPADDRLCRQLTDPDRLSVMQLMQGLLTDPALDRFSVVLFFARRQGGESTITLEQVEEGLNYQDFVEAMKTLGEVQEVEQAPEDAPGN